MKPTPTVVLLSSIILAVVVVIFSLPYSAAQTTNSPDTQLQTFQGWQRPKAALVITGQQYGYVEPCGCTGLANQKGGLARRDSMLQFLENERKWNVVPIDTGNLVRRIGPQAVIKFQYTVRAMREMQYQALGIGPDDLNLAFTDLVQAVVPQGAEDQSDLFVSANVDIYGFVPQYRIIETGGIRIGVTSILGDEFLEKIPHAEIQTQPAFSAARQSVRQMRAAGCGYCIVMAHTSEANCRKLAQTVSGIDLIVVADGTGEPRFRPETVDRTSLIKVGPKGMYANVVGLNQTAGQPVQLRYQRLPMDAQWPDSRRMLDAMAEYQRLLKTAGLKNLGAKPTPHIDGQFVGSQICGECHTQAYDKWLQTPHHEATTSIAEPTERSEIVRHFDPECLSCHVTGWSPKQYRPYTSGYESLAQSAHLIGNGCENCHGPGKAHVDAENGDIDLTENQIRQLRAKIRLKLAVAEQKCMECHDLDNSPDFHEPGAFEAYWKEVAHPGLD